MSVLKAQPIDGRVFRSTLGQFCTGVVIAAGTVGNGYSREQVIEGCSKMAWESHKPYWRSLGRHARQYGMAATLGKAWGVGRRKVVGHVFSQARLSR